MYICSEEKKIHFYFIQCITLVSVVSGCVQVQLIDNTAVEKGKLIECTFTVPGFTKYKSIFVAFTVYS